MTRVTGDTFNLIDLPWIQVRLVNGDLVQLSLTDVFERARDIKRISGDLPTQDFSILRLLLAVTYRSLKDEYFSTDDWGRYWEEGVPLDKVKAHLEQYRERFDLLHPETPFFQVADLRTAKDETKEVATLLFDVPSNNRLFSMRAGVGLESLSYAEAARWLVHLQAYDVSGIKSGAVGDRRVKGGKGYPLGVAWAGLLGGVALEGNNLHETLLLNLVEPNEINYDDDDDAAPWELSPHTAEEDLAGQPPRGTAGLYQRLPRGPVDLFTWQSRRIRLVVTGGTITSCVVSNGDKLTPQNLFDVEPMTAWRFSEPQTKKHGIGTIYMPKEHDPSRSFWRGLSALLPGLAVGQGGSGPAPGLVPGVISWVSRLKEGYLPSSQLISVHAVGVLYGAQSSVVSDIVDDRLDVSIALLRETNPALAACAVSAVEAAEGAVLALKNLAGDLAQAAGGEGVGDRKRADESAFYELDRLFRDWVVGLNEDTDPSERLEEWRGLVRRLMWNSAEELLNQASPAAWRGRVRDGATTLNVPLAELRFRRGLDAALGRSIEPIKKGGAA
ncbi:type I-E CRISPR-associated protein Cse1/CasA [Psychromicrobium xiongbiense]|uniref:type I-E CRISPR-associated protein Cse1/CasA n=1 Tax=Psychromicrobium xiongbiense TaxID=3051184 RepID=UPI002555318B|nr:type I-E CRISPR-associated protein Cse1/CasA [Psychromicrobium sp. YIM S02556]